jgi:hypothetical protein
MEENIRDTGKMENNMAKENFSMRKVINGEEASGMMVKELDGLQILNSNSIHCQFFSNFYYTYEQLLIL